MRCLRARERRARANLLPYPHPMNPLTTPYGRYLIVRGRLWRTTNPSLSEQERERLVHDLMDARRAVKAVKSNGDADSLATARQAGLKESMLSRFRKF